MNDVDEYLETPVTKLFKYNRSFVSQRRIGAGVMPAPSRGGRAPVAPAWCKPLTRAVPQRNAGRCRHFSTGFSTSTCEHPVTSRGRTP